jgi:putative Mn2+ efflux pump MntP
MDMITVLIAFGLAMDSFSVSISNGLANKDFSIKNALKIGVLFGLFQGIMPVLGWLAGVKILDLISGFDHWLAFLLACMHLH